MKKITIIILLGFSLYSNIFSQQYWINMAKIANKDLKKCFFVDTLNGWAVGDSGLIIHTSNGGSNWVRQESYIKERISLVYFINNRLGWAVGWGLGPDFYGTYILKTTNGGNKWDTTSYQVTSIYIDAIHFLDSLTGFMGGVPAILLKTTNAGLNWEKVNMDTTVIATRFPILKFKFYSKNYGFGFGGATDIAGVIWRTTNEGNYWDASIVSPEPLHDAKIFDSLNIVAIGGDFEYGVSLLKSTNGGNNWIYKSLEYFGVPNSLSFRTENEGWIIMGDQPRFYMTTNSGLKWNEIETPDTARIHDVMFVNSKFGVGVGTNGTFIKYNSALINIGNNEDVLSKFNLKQNYPNPFNPSTSIEYSVSEISNVELKVHNSIGQDVQTIYKGIRPAGSYSARFFGNGFPSGIYFYKLEISNIKTGVSSVITKKMVLLK